jgi:hypothetical protein
MADTPRLTRAQRRQQRRERRNSPAAKARRLARLQQKQALALDRFEAMKANEFDAAWQVTT